MRLKALLLVFDSASAGLCVLEQKKNKASSMRILSKYSKWSQNERE
jgi:hypothetical protein